MPELPEVETIRNNLRLGIEGQPSILGWRAARTWLLWERTLAVPTPQEFHQRLPGQVVEEVGRRGKFLILHFSHDSLIFHLRMSGDLWVEPQEAPVAAHHRLMVDFDHGLRLAFNDARKFGRVWLVDDPQRVVGALGPEPFDPQLSPEVFYQRLHIRRRLLKPLLLDQTFLAGLGNIYTDEALHLARLHPLALSHQLSFSQSERLLSSIRQVLEMGIRTHGASIDWVYRGGDFQNHFQVYRRTGAPCPACGAPIERTLVGQRGTHFCPDCQPHPGG